MSVEQVSASRITCDHDGGCDAQMHGPLLANSSEVHSGGVTRDEVALIRTAARERGWSTSPDLCPKHR